MKVLCLTKFFKQHKNVVFPSGKPFVNPLDIRAIFI